MDIVELSLKMEANLLANYSTESVSSETLNHRLTRSQTNKGQKRLIQESAVQENIIPQRKKAHREFEVEKNYLNKKAKVVHKNLETIYENPIWKNGNTLLLGTSKVKRSIYLDREFRKSSKQKSKLRKIKIKRLGKRIKPFKISDEEFNKRMLKIEDFLNGSSEELHGKNMESDVEFTNCESNQDCNNVENGNTQSSGNDDSCSSENKDFELIHEFETD